MYGIMNYERKKHKINLQYEKTHLALCATMLAPSILPVHTTMDYIHTISGTAKIEEKHTGNTIKTILALWMTIVTLNNTILTQW